MMRKYNRVEELEKILAEEEMKIELYDDLMDMDNNFELYEYIVNHFSLQGESDTTYKIIMPDGTNIYCTEPGNHEKDPVEASKVLMQFVANDNVEHIECARYEEFISRLQAF